MNKKALIILVHLVVNIVVQLGFFILTVFSQEYSTKCTIIWVIVGISATCADYCICVRILRGKRVAIPWISHFADLIFAMPTVILWVYCIVLDIIHRDIIQPQYSNYEIVLIIGIILVDVCLMMERLGLVKKGGLS